MDIVTEERQCDWIQTRSGKKFWPLDPRPEDVRLFDIIISLSRINRYLGHTRRRSINVASHSLLVDDILKLWKQPSMVRMQGLMHDAHEAYLGDHLRPVGAYTFFRLLDGEVVSLSDMKDRVQKVISTSLNIKWPYPEIIDQADLVALAAEGKAYMDTTEWAPLPEVPKGLKVVLYPEEEAENKFMYRFTELNMRLKGLWD